MDHEVNFRRCGKWQCCADLRRISFRRCPRHRKLLRGVRTSPCKGLASPRALGLPAGPAIAQRSHQGFVKDEVMGSAISSSKKRFPQFQTGMARLKKSGPPILMVVWVYTVNENLEESLPETKRCFCATFFQAT